MVQKEVDTLLTQTAMQMSNMGIDIRQLFTQENIQQMRSRTRPEAVKNIKKKLILEEIAQKESLEISPEEVEAKLQKVKEQLSGQEIDAEKLEAMVKEELRQTKTLDWLQEKATVELVPEGSLSEVEAEIEAEAEIEVEAEIEAEAEAEIEVEATKAE